MTFMTPADNVRYLVSKYLGLAALLFIILGIQVGSASDSFEVRTKGLSKTNKSFAAAQEILSKPEINTPDEIKKAVIYFSAALDSEKLDPHKSVIHIELAWVYLMGLNDCSLAKQHSEIAVRLGIDTNRALEVDVACDMCLAGIKGDHRPVINRLEKLVEQGVYFKSLYSLIGLAYMHVADRAKTNSQADLLKARQAFLKAKERGEPEASPNAFELSIQELDRRLAE